MCGLAGALAAFHDGFVWPNMLGVLLSTQIVLYVLFGGVGTLVGAVVGVASIDYMSFVLADRFPAFWPILLGLLLLFVVLVRPTGLCGLVVSERERGGRFGRARVAVPTPERKRLMALLEVAGVAKRFGQLQALAGVDLTVEPGQIHGLIGPNGSGKSTLMKCIAGALVPDAGTIRFAGRDITTAPPAERARAGLSIKFQITSVLPALSVYDNILLALQARSSLGTLIRSATRRALHERGAGGARPRRLARPGRRPRRRPVPRRAAVARDRHGAGLAARRSCSSTSRRRG